MWIVWDMIKKIISYLWHSKERRIERFENAVQSDFQKAHQGHLDKRKHGKSIKVDWRCARMGEDRQKDEQ